jgi:hypothetical protein
MDLAATTGGKGRGESSILDTTLEETRRQIGRNSRVFTVPRPLKVYHRFMFAVDKGDQSRMHLGGFARKAHFQKWYKKSFFAILDCMLLNGWISWNMSVEELPRVRRNTLERFEFYKWIATSFLSYQDEEVPAAASHQKKAPPAVSSGVQTCPLVNLKVENDTNRDCIVCRLDGRYAKSKVGVKKHTLFCETCSAYVHVQALDDNEKRVIHGMFPGKTCNEILKSGVGMHVWCTGDAGQRSVRTKHPFVKELRTKLGYIAGSNKQKRTSEP